MLTKKPGKRKKKIRNIHLGSSDPSFSVLTAAVAAGWGVLDRLVALSPSFSYKNKFIRLVYVVIVSHVNIIPNGHMDSLNLDFFVKRLRSK